MFNLYCSGRKKKNDAGTFKQVISQPTTRHRIYYELTNSDPVHLSHTQFRNNKILSITQSVKVNLYLWLFFSLGREGKSRTYCVTVTMSNWN